MTTSLLTPEAFAMIGTAESGAVEIAARDFQRWAAAAGDLNPLYFDADHLSQYGNDVLLPAFLHHVGAPVRDGA